LRECGFSKEFVLPSKEEELKKDQPTPEPSDKPEKKAKAKAEPTAEATKSEEKAKDGEQPTTDEKAEPAPKPQAATAKAEDGSEASPTKRKFFAKGFRPAGNLKSTIIKVTSVVVALLAVVVIVFGVLIYAYKSESPAVATVAQVVPYPALQVNGRFVSYHDYLFEVDANKRAYQNNAKLNNQPAVDFNSDDGKKLVKQIKEHAIEKLKSDALVAQLAGQ
jgi:hypothetical protein